MQAIVHTRYGAPDVLQVQKLAKPNPQANEVLIRVGATTVSAADCIYRQGDKWIARLFSGIRKPKRIIPGTCYAGEVVAVGAAVLQFKAGDRVFGATGDAHGTHVEYLCMPADSAMAIMPGNMSYAEAAGVCDGGLTALPFLRDHGRVKPGQRVLINGASGAVGSYAVQLARSYAAEVTAVCSTSNLELVRSLGAQHVIDYTAEDFTQTGQRYDVIFDAIGKSSFSKCKHALVEGGRYLTTYPSIRILLQMLWTAKLGRKKAIFAATGLRKPADRTRDLIFLRWLIEAGKLKSAIDKSYPWEQFAAAHRHVDTGHKKGNVVILVPQAIA